MRASQKQTEKRLKYSQNEEDDTGSRYQKIPSDDGSQSNLGGVRGRRADGQRIWCRVYDPQGELRKSSRETLKRGSIVLGTVGGNLGVSGAEEIKSLLRPLQIQSLAVYQSLFAFISRLMWRLWRLRGNFSIGDVHSGNRNGGIGKKWDNRCLTSTGAKENNNESVAVAKHEHEKRVYSLFLSRDEDNTQQGRKHNYIRTEIMVCICSTCSASSFTSCLAFPPDCQD